jgi:hypothetical protein
VGVFIGELADEKGVKDPKRKNAVKAAEVLDAEVAVPQKALAKIDDDPKKATDLAAGGKAADEADAEMKKLDAGLVKVQAFVATTLASWGKGDEPLPAKDWLKISRPSFTVTHKANIALQHEATNERLEAAGKDATDHLKKNSKGKRVNMKAGQARRHVVSSDDMAKHYGRALMSKSTEPASSLRSSTGKLLIEQRGSVAGARVPVAGTTQEAIKAAAIARHGAFFGYAKNFFIGDSKENSSIQAHLDDGHPEMAETELRNHVRLMKRAWAMDASFEETPVRKA